MEQLDLQEETGPGRLHSVAKEGSTGLSFLRGKAWPALLRVFHKNVIAQERGDTLTPHGFIQHIVLGVLLFILGNVLHPEWIKNFNF